MVNAYLYSATIKRESTVAILSRHIKAMIEQMGLQAFAKKRHLKRGEEEAHVQVLGWLHMMKVVKICS